MEQAKKQRLVGTAVLIALAVILVPMILDFSRNEQLSGEEIKAPSAPDVNKMQVLPLDVWSQKLDPEVEPEPVYLDPDEPEPAPESSVKVVDLRVSEEPSQASERQAEPKAETKPAKQLPTKPQPVAAEPTPKPVEPVKIVEKAEKAPEADPVVDLESEKKAKQDKALPGRAWTVQLISVTSKSKAMAFRQKLIDKGYSAYVTEGHNSSGTLFYRVRVGPEQLRSKIDELHKRLEQDTGIKGLVMRY